MAHPFFSVRFLALALCLAFATADAPAQSPAPKDGKTTQRAVTIPTAAAHVRFWKTDLRSFPFLRVTLVPAKSAPKQRGTARELGSGRPGYLFNNYVDVPSGHSTLEVFDSPASASIESVHLHGLVNLPVDFAPGSFVTVLLDEPREANTPPQLNVIVDGPNDDKTDTSPAQINVRNFVAGLQDVRVTFGDSLNAQFTGGNNYLQMQGLKPIIYAVRTAGTGVDGKPFEWITEADLRQHRHQTLLIYPDPYGRVRPRMTVDRENPTELPAEKQPVR